MAKLIDLTGQRFGRLTVIERAENRISPNGTQKARWSCQCDCGSMAVVDGQDLRNGRVKSCGCFMRACTTQKNTTHGKRNTRLYDIWRGMKERCQNPGHIRYEKYGGRGITVCPQWLNDFQAFYDWAMSHGYEEGLTIDRVDNDCGYSPENCRWVDNERQANNKKNNRLFTINGRTKTLADWCKLYCVKYNLAFDRLRHGWTIEEALDLVPRKK